MLQKYLFTIFLVDIAKLLRLKFTKWEIEFITKKIS